MNHDEERLNTMIGKGEAKEFDHDGVRMVCFPRVVMGKRESSKTVQQASRSKGMAAGTFEKLQEMFEGLGWEMLPKPAANEPQVFKRIVHVLYVGYLKHRMQYPVSDSSIQNFMLHEIHIGRLLHRARLS
jgi:hypothetical protein